MRVLDLGCGSGILAIAAARLGATVLALDTDPIAVTATRENAAYNDVTQQVSVAEGSLGGGAALGHWLGWEPERSNVQTFKRSNVQFDLIVANIIARVLAALARDMANALAFDGTLITSGIIADREQEVVEAFAQAGLTQLERRQEGDWVALVYQKKRR